jgi:hypothetical protein
MVEGARGERDALDLGAGRAATHAKQAARLRCSTDCSKDKPSTYMSDALERGVICAAVAELACSFLPPARRGYRLVSPASWASRPAWVRLSRPSFSSIRDT